MEVFFLVMLFIFWLLFWSFASVIIYRLKSWERWMFLWRSHCSHCNTLLQALDLIPLFSYVFHRGSCKYCRKAVSKIYPFLEASMALLFVWVWYFLVDYSLIFSWNKEEIVTLFFYLCIAFLTVVFVFYDILFLEIPESILFIAILFAFLWSSSDFLFGTSLLPYSSFSWIHMESILAVLVGVAVISFFYIILLKGLHEMYDLLILFCIWVVFLLLWIFVYTDFFSYSLFSWLVWAYAIFLFFFSQIVVSKWAWLGGWDLRIAILMWLLLWITASWYGILATYCAGSIIGMAIISYKKIKSPKEKVSTIIPFWPFLAIGIFIVLFFYESIHKMIVM